MRSTNKYLVIREVPFDKISMEYRITWNTSLISTCANFLCFVYVVLGVFCACDFLCTVLWLVFFDFILFLYTYSFHAKKNVCLVFPHLARSLPKKENSFACFMPSISCLTFRLVCCGWSLSATPSFTHLFFSCWKICLPVFLHLARILPNEENWFCYILCLWFRVWRFVWGVVVGLFWL